MLGDSFLARGLRGLKNIHTSPRPPEASGRKEPLPTSYGGYIDLGPASSHGAGPCLPPVHVIRERLGKDRAW